jgi:hypothetical protein
MLSDALSDNPGLQARYASYLLCLGMQHGGPWNITPIALSIEQAFPSSISCSFIRRIQMDLLHSAVASNTFWFPVHSILILPMVICTRMHYRGALHGTDQNNICFSSLPEGASFMDGAP